MNAAFRFAKLRFFVGLLSVFLGVFGLTAFASASANTRTEKCLEVATVPGSDVAGSCPTFKGAPNEDSYSKSDDATCWFDVTLGAAKYIYDESSRGTVRIMASSQRDSTCDGLPHPSSVQVKASKYDALVLFRETRFGMATKPGASTGRTFDIDPRVAGQLQDARLGSLQGKLTEADLQRLANSPTAQRVYDTASGNVNIIQEVDGKLIRVTVAGDKFKIISVGPIKPNGLANGITNGRFVPIGGGK